MILSSKAVEIPLNYVFTLNPEAGSGLKSVLYTGLIYTPMYFTKQTLINSSGRFVNSNHVSPLLKYALELNLGVEMRQNLNEDYNLAFGPSLRVQPYTYYGFDLFSENRNPLVFNLNLKFGRNL